MVIRFCILLAFTASIAMADPIKWDPQFESPDWRVVLGVDSSADSASILIQYRTLSRKYHADAIVNRSPEEKELASFITKQVNWAFDQFNSNKGRGRPSFPPEVEERLQRARSSARANNNYSEHRGQTGRNTSGSSSNPGASTGWDDFTSGTEGSSRQERGHRSTSGASPFGSGPDSEWADFVRKQWGNEAAAATTYSVREGHWAKSAALGMISAFVTSAATSASLAGLYYYGGFPQWTDHLMHIGLGFGGAQAGYFIGVTEALQEGADRYGVFVAPKKMGMAAGVLGTIAGWSCAGAMKMLGGQ